ncbi:MULTISPECIES: DUF3599 family protein [Bacillus]|uniref:Phage-like element PBSX protein XkdH n=1 Tax=Bacillus sonorensis TaxID=119858 RepID=A0ABN5AIE1_9BACI|nr:MULTISPECIES: DUF3599 family protein [Bacillus]ASB88432.1 Phage-like element PBSX protein XkdH [Bacillus sonorensis]NWN81185.1 YqbH/XkdH family protein [Bacillus sp. (in: firmicutes)]RHJ05910.1 DUF3599 family protein [Bacillus sonorensis]GIN67677.1 hypothetical protein J41TS2_30980 [Bacillus sonorensis]
MSYNRLLTHRCDVYHLKEEQPAETRYGVPVQDGQPTFSYPDDPDISDQPCYFTEKNQSVVQQEPNTLIVQSLLVHFPVSADIRLNDKVTWEGASYKLQQPRKIKNHHIEVTAVRRDNL